TLQRRRTVRRSTSTRQGRCSIALVRQLSRLHEHVILLQRCPASLHRPAMANSQSTEARMKRVRCVIVLLSALLLLTSAAHAAPTLIATGSLSGTYEDLALQTAASLENGMPGNRLGGIGSGLAYAGGNIFLALPDRGPNAKSYNSAVDDTTSFIPRFHTLHLSLAPSDPGSALPFTLTPMLIDTTLLWSR